LKSQYIHSDFTTPARARAQTHTHTHTHTHSGNFYAVDLTESLNLEGSGGLVRFLILFFKTLNLNNTHCLSLSLSLSGWGFFFLHYPHPYLYLTMPPCLMCVCVCVCECVYLHRVGFLHYHSIEDVDKVLLALKSGMLCKASCSICTRPLTFQNFGQGLGGSRPRLSRFSSRFDQALLRSLREEWRYCQSASGGV
jgi:hypothetical protein